MRIRFVPLASLVAATAVTAVLAAELSPTTPLIEKSKWAVTVADFNAALARVPQESRNEVLMNHEYVSTLIDGVYTARSLADRARGTGLDKDPVVQRRIKLAEENVLAEEYLQRVSDNAAKGDLEVRAAELYKAFPDKAVMPELVHVQGIYVDLWGRTPEMALARAQEIHDKAVAPKADFLELVTTYSNDPDKAKTKGDFGLRPVSQVEEFARAAVAKLKKKGDVTAPVKDPKGGYFVFRLVERRASEPLPYEKVKAVIIKEERARLAKAARENLMTELRSDTDVVVHRDNVEALILPTPKLPSKVPSPTAQK
jgi:parvulin-like peptidyl-prolyl isomerase